MRASGGNTMLYIATILEHWFNNAFQLCHKWDHRSCLIIKISHASTLAIAWYSKSILHLGVSTKISTLKKNKKKNRPEATTIYTLFFASLHFPLHIRSSSSPRGNCSWHIAHEPNEKFYLQSAGGGVFALHICRDLIWMCLMCAWNSKCQPGGRWVGMCSEA